jgi:hypothetical protein
MRAWRVAEGSDVTAGLRANVFFWGAMSLIYVRAQALKSPLLDSRGLRSTVMYVTQHALWALAIILIFTNLAIDLVGSHGIAIIFMRKLFYDLVKWSFLLQEAWLVEIISYGTTLLVAGIVPYLSAIQPLSCFSHDSPAHWIPLRTV